MQSKGLADIEDRLEDLRRISAAESQTETDAVAGKSANDSENGHDEKMKRFGESSLLHRLQDHDRANGTGYFAAGTHLGLVQYDQIRNSNERECYAKRNSTNIARLLRTKRRKSWN